MVGRHVGEVLEPEDAHGREHPALVGHRLGHHDVEGREPVRRHHEQPAVAGVVEVAHLARVDVGERDRHGSTASRAAKTASV